MTKDYLIERNGKKYEVIIGLEVHDQELSESKLTINCNNPDIRCEINNENPRNLQWHHVLPKTKYKAVAEIVSQDRCIKKVNAEIDKCICVCKACHGLLEM